MSRGLGASLLLVLVGCGPSTEGQGGERRVDDVHATEVPSRGTWVPAAPRPQVLAPAPLSSAAAKVAERCPVGTVDSSTLAMIAAPPSVQDSALFTVVQDAATQRSRLQRLGGTGCALTPQLEWTYQEVEVADGLLSAGHTNVFVSLGSSVQQVNHRRCGETTVGPFRWVSKLAASPSEQRLALQNCGSWFGMKLEATGWVHDATLSAALQSVEETSTAVLLDDALVAAVSAEGALTVLASDSGLSARFDVTLDGALPRPESLTRCGHGAVCLAYPDAGFAARWSDQGELLDLVRMGGLARGEQVVRVAREDQGSGFYLLLSGPEGSSLAYVP
ncbi:MAG: hypothetical protein AB1938_04820 [Myxococcota bacterium]